ncbi:MAG TPA: ATP-binding protein [Phycisphaerae bacterium]|nr:ATP-binding protein [Phycisphaerae bacterium]
MELRRVETVEQIATDLEAIKRLQDTFLNDLRRQGYDADTTSALALGFSEAVANAYHHGNRGDPSKRITVCYRFDRCRAELEVSDQGEGFDPNDLPDATSDDALARPSGRGVLLMRSLFDEVRYLRGGRAVYLAKQVPTVQACAA